MEATYIEIYGQNAEVKAKAIANFFNTTCEKVGDTWQVKCNDELENDLCKMDEIGFENTINNIILATGVNINIEDICF